MATITAANSVFMLSVAGLYPAPQQIQGFAADDAFTSQSVQGVETALGVDGIMSVGWLPTMTPMDLMLQSDSDSCAILDAWWEAQQIIQEVYIASALISLPATGQKYNLVRGVLSKSDQMPGVKKTLAPRKYELIWNKILRSPI